MASHGIRIGELAKQSGVTKATIQHYVAVGLIAKPRKTGQTMAYYDPQSVARIAFIKDLQARHLPLAVIRALIGSPREHRGRDEWRLLAASATTHFERATHRDDVARELGIPVAAIVGLERLGIVHSHDDALSPHDVAILRAIFKLAAAGLNPSNGFRSEDLLLWRDALSALLVHEIELFVRNVVPNHPPAEVARLASAAIEGSTELVAALHRKLIADLLAAVLPR